jgi:hypothetical protein
VYYKNKALSDEVVAMVIISSALCFSLGGSARLLFAAICAIHRYQLFHRTYEIQCRKRELQCHTLDDRVELTRLDMTI